jgi:hypothetical protein
VYLADVLACMKSNNKENEARLLEWRQRAINKILDTRLHRGIRKHILPECPERTAPISRGFKAERTTLGFLLKVAPVWF